MILGVIVLRVSTILQKALAFRVKIELGREFRSDPRFLPPIVPAVKDQTFPGETEINGKKPGSRFIYHWLLTVVAFILSQLLATHDHY